MFTEFLSREAGRISTELDASGYCLVRGAVPAEQIAKIDRDLAPSFETAPRGSGSSGEARTRRFGRLLVRAPATERLVRHYSILNAVEDILVHGSNMMQLSLTQGIAVHPGELAGMPSRNQDMWPGAKGRFEYLVNVVWPLTPARRENGTIRIWPGSHGRGAQSPQPSSDGLPIEMEPGDALLFLGSALHSAGANCSNAVTRAVLVGYCLGWLKPCENQWLAYPPEIARNFSPELAALVGYNRHCPDLGNFEGHCPSVLLDPRHAGAFAIEEDQTVEGHEPLGESMGWLQ